MSELDYSYIARLVYRTCSGSSDAFAELFASTYKRQYALACAYLDDPELARDALRDTYDAALKSLDSLRDTRLFVSWLTQINFRVCYSMSTRLDRISEGDTNDVHYINIAGQSFPMNRVLALPFSESQVIYLRYHRHMSLRQIAYLLEIKRFEATEYLSRGRRRLKLQEVHAGGEENAV